MVLPFLLQSFFIGILAASGCGPVFILTFNRSAVGGFWKGFATAFGASIGDSFYFFLGLLGALAVIGELKYFMIVLDIVGGLLLLYLGIHSLRKMRQTEYQTVESSYGLVSTAIKAFTLNILNPLVILFFMAVTLQVLPDNVALFSFYYVVICSLSVFFGSLTVLTLVSGVASFLGSSITQKRLRIVSAVTGILFISFGLYLIRDFVLHFFS